MKISKEEISSKVSELAGLISSYYEKILGSGHLNVVVPMAGGLPFAVDISREISFPLSNKISINYIFDDDGTWKFCGDHPRKSHSILIIEDIYDSGETLSELIEFLKEEYSPNDLKIVVMLNKKIKKIVSVNIDWQGFEIEDTWVYGYGMDDHNGTRRQLSFISDE